MRKSNSIFKTAFVSESGAKLHNSDYFAYVELDDFACYVLASEITDFETSEAAKDAVENLILNFQEKPGLKKSSLIQYMKEVNERFLAGGISHRPEASVIMVVTDYEKFRYVAAGNVRLRMYRNGRFFLKSADMSLANDLVERGEIETPLDKHEERHNLYAYLGKKDFFKPYVSKIQKLSDADIISLYSQGLWENVDELELDEIFAEASDDPQETVDTLEEVLLSRQPKDLQSYTIVTIFVNKVFKDPERERKRLFYIKAAIITIIIILLIALAVFLYRSWRQSKVDAFEKTMHDTIQYMNKENFPRAQENCKNALDMAKDLGRKEDEETLTNYLLLLDNLVIGENFFNTQNYQSSYMAFVRASEYSTGADQIIYNFIRRRLADIGWHLEAAEFLELGDANFSNGDFDTAEGMYLKARERAASVHDSERQAQAVAALEKLYDKKAELKKDAEQKIDDKKKATMNDIMKKGDDLLAAGDLEGAQAAYLQARNLTDDPTDRASTTAALEKVTAAKEKKEVEEKSSEEEVEREKSVAKETEEAGNEAYNAKDYLTAQAHYSQAADAYRFLHDEASAQAALEKYQLAHLKYIETRGEKMKAENAEQTARNNYADKNYNEAQTAAEEAKRLYTQLGMKEKVSDMDVLLQQIMADAAIDSALQN